MIRYENSNLLLSEAQALVNPVNCEGVGGTGLALAFKEASPVNFMQYKAACIAGFMKPGNVCSTEVSGRYIMNAATKGYWRERSKLEWIESCIANLRQAIEVRGIQSISIPQLGCGLGGLSWDKVQPVIEQLSDLDCSVTVHIV